VPTRYELTIAPDLGAATFVGHERINLDVSSETRSIVCTQRASDLRATLNWPDDSNHRVGLEISFNEDLERVTFSAPRQILSWFLHSRVRIRGILNDKLCGFYRSTFRDEAGEEQVIATTQFESTDARRAFPCWDEPDRKAVFAVTLEVNADLLAISNGAEFRSTELPMASAGSSSLRPSRCRPIWSPS